MKFSAAKLVKQSAAQMLYFELRSIKWKATRGQLKGNEYAEAVAEKEGGVEERRGTIEHDGDLIFFCVDLVQGDKFIEIKHVDPDRPCEDWYLESSIMQSALYASLLEDVEVLFTPKFRRKEGYKQEVTVVPDKKTFELWFGEDKYIVYPDQNIKDHYLQKAKLVSSSVTAGDYCSCRSFDSQFKREEFRLFAPRYDKISA